MAGTACDTLSPSRGPLRPWHDQDRRRWQRHRTRMDAPRRQAQSMAACLRTAMQAIVRVNPTRAKPRSEEHTSELQSLMRNSYAVFCLKTKKHKENKKSHRLNNNNTNA